MLSQSYIQLNNVCKNHTYSQAIDQISIQINQFEKIAIIGETGAGKTTLLKLICGLEQPDSGSIYYKGERILGSNEQLIPGHHEMAYLSQHYELFNNYFIHEFLSYNNENTAEYSSYIFNICDINHLLLRKTNELSGGEKQRVAMAKQLLTNPSILLLDEPFSNADAHHRKKIKKLLQEISEKLNTTILMVSHDYQEVISWADRIFIMQHGRICQSGSPFELYHYPQDEYCAGLTGDFILYDQNSEYVFKKLIPTLVFENNKRFFCRPEYFSIVDNTKLSIPTIVDTIHFNGNHLLLECKYNDLPLKILTFHKDVFIGKTVHVSFNQNKPWFI